MVCGASMYQIRITNWRASNEITKENKRKIIHEDFLQSGWLVGIMLDELS